MKIKYALIAGAFMLATTGCADSGHGTIDAPVDQQQNNEPAHIVNMPDGFMNIAWKCEGHNGIYAHTRDAAPVVVPNDPNCTASR